MTDTFAAPYRQIADLRALSPERTARARTALVEMALQLVLVDRLSALRKAQLLADIAAVIPDLGLQADPPFGPVRDAVWALTEGYTDVAVLRLCLADMFTARAGTSFATWTTLVQRESAGQVLE